MIFSETVVIASAMVIVWSTGTSFLASVDHLSSEPKDAVAGWAKQNMMSVGGNQIHDYGM